MSWFPGARIAVLAGLVIAVVLAVGFVLKVVG